MGYAGKIEEKAEAIRLRKKGFSYNEIRKKIPVSKSSLSLWCRDVAITKNQALRLLKKQSRGADKGRMISAKKQQRVRIEKINELRDLGKKEVGGLTKRERFIAGISLYAGDGLKGDKNVGFSNSNSVIIKFMNRWFREFCKTDKLRGSIWIHEGLDKDKAKKYWSRITGIPIEQFTKTYVVKNKKDSKKIRKNVNENGVLAIRIFNADLQRKIKGWMSGVLGDDIV
jgi:hypothetical protein